MVQSSMKAVSLNCGCSCLITCPHTATTKCLIITKIASLCPNPLVLCQNGPTCLPKQKALLNWVLKPCIISTSCVGMPALLSISHVSFHGTLSEIELAVVDGHHIITVPFHPALPPRGSIQFADGLLQLCLRVLLLSFQVTTSPSCHPRSFLNMILPPHPLQERSALLACAFQS